MLIKSIIKKRYETSAECWKLVRELWNKIDIIAITTGTVETDLKYSNGMPVYDGYFVEIIFKLYI